MSTLKYAAKLLYFTAFFYIAALQITVYKNHLGTLSSTAPHQWLTASTVNFVENWQHDGFFNDKAMMLELPRSIESNTLTNRSPYISYLPGAPIEIALLKHVFRQSSTLKLTQLFNIANQFLIALILAGIVFYGTSSCPGLYRYLLGLLVFLGYQSLPAIVYVHAMVFFADQAVLLPLVLVLLLELSIRKKAAINAPVVSCCLLQSGVLLWVTACDWLAIPLIISLFIYRFFSPLPGYKSLSLQCLQLFLLPGLLLLLFAMQLYQTGLWPLLLERFMLRSGQYDAMHWDRLYFISNFFIRSLGLLNFIFMLGSIVYIYYLYYKKKSLFPELVIIAAILISTCLLHAFLLPNHARVHAEFSIVKFYLFIVLILLGIIPALLLTEKKEKSYLIMLPFALFFIWYHLVSVPGNYTKTLFTFDSHVDYQEIAFWLRKHAAYNDVYISRNMAITANPPQAISYSRKAIHHFSSWQALQAFFARLPTTTNYYAILHKQDIAQCGLNATDIITTIQSGNQDWVIVKFATQHKSRLVRYLIKKAV